MSQICYIFVTDKIKAMTKKLERRLEKLKEKELKMSSDHAGKENSIYTYHAGWDLGYVQGKINEIENFIDVISDKIKELEELAKYYGDKADRYVITKQESESDYGSIILGSYQEKEMMYKGQIRLLEWVLEQC